MIINENTLIYDVIIEHPEVENVFKAHGIRCFGWGGFAYHSIGYAAKVLRIETNKLIDEINIVINNR